MSPTHKMLTCIYLSGMVMFFAGIQTAEKEIDMFRAMMILYPLYGIIIGYSWLLFFAKAGKRIIKIYSYLYFAVMLAAIGLIIADMRGIPLHYSWIPFLGACVITARHIINKYNVMDNGD